MGLFNKLCQKLKNKFKNQKIVQKMKGYSNFTSSGEAAYGSAGEQPYKE